MLFAAPVMNRQTGRDDDFSEICASEKNVCYASYYARIRLFHIPVKSQKSSLHDTEIYFENYQLSILIFSKIGTVYSYKSPNRARYSCALRLHMHAAYCTFIVRGWKRIRLCTDELYYSFHHVRVIYEHS